jgi:carbon monoxide dehydrogenase subunit G
MIGKMTPLGGLQNTNEMATFESKVMDVNASCEEVFEFLGDFRNFESLMPEQVANWQATESSCSFRIQGVSDLSMRMDSKSAGRNIHIVADGENPVDFSLDFFLHKKNEQACRVSVVFNAELNPFTKMMASRPLQSLVDLMAQKIKERF